MATKPELIYCANGNGRFAQIAVDNGFTYGAQMPGKAYLPPVFVDLHPTHPPKQWRYIDCLRKWRPRFASVHDWHSGRDLMEVMLRAEEIAEQVSEAVLIIPKVPGTIKHIPRHINGKMVILGYSVPTKHGATDVDRSEFKGWPVHLLGGSPHNQILIWQELRQIADVVSVDGNMHHLLATTKNAFWYLQKFPGRGYWPSLAEFDGDRWGDGSSTADAPYEAFRRSCVNIMEAWSRL